MKATKEGKLIKTTGDILGNSKVQKTIKSMVKSLLPITERTQYCTVDCGKEICQCKPSKKIQMNKEQTAMQILIEKMRKIRDDIPTNTQIQRTARGRVVDCIMQAKYLLEKEQEQIEMAFGDGVNEGENRCEQEEISLSIGEYYQSKYGGEYVDR